MASPSPVELLKSVFDVSKLPTRFFVVGVVGSGCCLFFPTAVLARLHLDAVVAAHGGLVGAVFLACFVMVAVNFLVWLISMFSGWWKKWRLRSRVAEMVRIAVAAVDDAEAAVLREFYLKAQSTLLMPFDNPAVAGLQRKGILHCVGQMGQSSVYGMFFPMVIDESARRLLTSSLLRIPEPLTDSGQKWLLENRPGFVRQQESLERLLHGIL